MPLQNLHVYCLLVETLELSGSELDPDSSPGQKRVFSATGPGKVWRRAGFAVLALHQ